MLIAVGVWDRLQKNHTILRNFPVFGHLRYWIERIGPELRQYIISGDRAELPFNRRDRSWVYATSKKQNNVYGFGTDANQSASGHVIVLPSLESVTRVGELGQLMCAKAMGPNRKRPWTPMIVGISGMSYGALSGPAVSALNQGAKMVGCHQNTGEGGLSEFHKSGADVIFQIGTGYNGVRNDDGTFSLEKLCKLVEENKFIRAIEIKLSQGAKPGHGAILPGAKVNATIAAVRGIEIGKDSVSPGKHTAFTGMADLVKFIELIADATGLPVGIKAAVGKTEQWEELAGIMSRTGKGPDFITIDGGEGGTGAAPTSFADSVALPFNEAFTTVKKIFDKYFMTFDPAKKLSDQVVFIGSAKLGLPANSVKAFAMGVDIVHVAREALFSIGCIQAQKCHTNHCPTSIALQDPKREKNLDVTLKSVRCKNYLKGLLKEIHEISNAAGYQHPSEFKPTDVKLATGDWRRYKNIKELFYDNIN